MTSVQSFYAQRDDRIINVALTGDINNNGVESGSIDVYNPAVASLNVNDSKLFTIDTRQLVLRPSGAWYLVGFVFEKIKPPRFYPGFEINIIINVKDTNGPPAIPIVFNIQKNPLVPLDYDDETTFIEVTNFDTVESTPGTDVYTFGTRVITLITDGFKWILKSSSLNTGPSSIYT